MTKEMIRTLFNCFNPRKNEPSGFMMITRSEVFQLEDRGLVRYASPKELNEYRRKHVTSSAHYYYVLTPAGIEMMNVLKNVHQVAKSCDQLGI